MNGGKLLGKGTIGHVFTIKDKNNNVIKISKKNKMNELKREYNIFKQIINIFPKKFIDRFFIISNESVINKKKIKNLLNEENIKNLNYNLNSNNSQIFSFILKKGIQYKNYRNTIENLEKFYFKIFYKLLISYNVCLKYDVANFDCKPTNTIIKEFNKVNEIISIDYDNIYFIKNKNELIQFKILAPGYTYYWPPEFWKHKEDSDIKDFLEYYFPSSKWKYTYENLNQYIKDTDYQELISKGMIWHLIHAFFFPKFITSVISKENIINSKNPILKHKELQELFIQALNPDPIKRISLIKFTSKFELLAKNGIFGKDVQTEINSKEINVSQIFGLNYKKGNDTIILTNNQNKPVFELIMEYYIDKNNKNNSIGGKKNIHKKNRKHKGIYQTGINAGKLKPGYKYSGNKTKTGLKIIVKK